MLGFLRQPNRLTLFYLALFYNEHSASTFSPLNGEKIRSFHPPAVNDVVCWYNMDAISRHIFIASGPLVSIHASTECPNPRTLHLLVKPVPLSAPQSRNASSTSLSARDSSRVVGEDESPHPAKIVARTIETIRAIDCFILTPGLSRNAYQRAHQQTADTIALRYYRCDGLWQPQILRLQTPPGATYR